MEAADRRLLAAVDRTALAIAYQLINNVNAIVPPRRYLSAGDVASAHVRTCALRLLGRRSPPRPLQYTVIVAIAVVQE